MKKDVLYIGGANRGARAFTDAALRILPDRKPFDRIIIADPKEDRALRLAQRWSDEGISSEGIKKPCEEAINGIEANVALLAIDNIKPMSKILERNNLPTQWQLLARGMGINAPLIALSGSIDRGNTTGRAQSIKLINVLSSFIEPQSSANIRQNPMNADALYLIRKKISEHSVKRLIVLDREPGSLNLLWGMKFYPMVVQDKPENESWKETKQQVFETKSGYSHFAVASVGQGNVDFFVVEQVRERRVIRLHLPLMHILSSDTNQRSELLSGLGLFSAQAPAPVPAVVTD